MVAPSLAGRLRAAALAALLAPAPLAADPSGAVVTAAVESLHSGPDVGRDVVSQAFVGQALVVLESRGGFHRVRTPDAYEGWIPASAVAGPPARPYAVAGAVAEVTSLLANLYRDADVTTARPLLQAPLGARLELAGAAGTGRWLAVRLPDERRAWVQRGDVRLVEATRAAEPGSGRDVVTTARRFLGAPYLWGGMSPLGVDCSGLVSRAYAVNGVVLPRDAHLQFDDPRATAVAREALEPGDLVFFGGKSITHVGIWAGDGVFVHATTHGRPIVQESRLDDPHWTGLYRGARRPPRAP